jgi:hypothetical protein
MQYLCPKCGWFMNCISTASIPAITYYQCFSCGYKSKGEKEQPLYMTLPKELWSDNEDIENEV